MTLKPADVAALARAQRGSTESAKDSARALHRIDQGAPRSAAQLVEALAAHGIHLSEGSVRRLRYVARLLHTLDPDTLNPVDVADVNDLEYLYRLQRAAEVARVGVRDLLAQIERDAPKAPREYLQNIIKARDAAVTPEARETWRHALPKVPTSAANRLNKAFGVWVKAHGLTPHLGVLALADTLEQGGVAGEMVAWARRVGLDEADAPDALIAVLRELPARHWRSLVDACRT